MQTPQRPRFLDRSTPPTLLTLVLLAGTSAMVMNMFLPSLPNMTEYFDTEYKLMQLSVSVYLGFSALMQLAVGPISDRYGRRPVLIWSMALFLLATVGCLLATTVETFLFFRMLQAVMAAGMALSRAVIRDLYDQDQSASMIGYVTMGMAVVPMISPAVGGVLDQAFGWKANFWAFAILGALMLWLVWADQGETARNTGQPFSQQVREYPALLTSPRFWYYAMAAMFCSGSFFAYLGGGPFVGSEVFGLSPATVGLYFGVPAVGYFIGNWITGRFATHFGVNNLVLWGCISNALGVLPSLAFFLVGAATPLTFFGLMTFVGIGNGLVIPNATAGMLSVRPRLAGTASGLGGAIMIGGGAALSAVAGIVLTPDSGGAPLLALMSVTSILALVCIIAVFHRERRLATLTPS